LGSKHHVICAGNGIPLALTVTAANRNDITQLLELVDRIAPVGPHGKFRPAVLLADRAYDSRRHRAELRDRGSRRRSPSATPPTARAWARNAGSSSAPSPGCTTTAASRVATTAAPTSTKRS
jgi:IS5 family transposase